MTAPVLATVDALKDYMGITGTADDALLKRSVDAATVYALNYVDRPLAVPVAAFTERADGTGRDRMLLRHYPLVSLVSVTIDGRAVQANEFELGESATADSRVLYRKTGEFPRGRRNVTVTGTHGWDAAPADLTQAVLEVAGLMYQKRKRLGETSKNIGDQTVAFSPKEVTDYARHTFEQYTNRVPL